MEQTRQPPSNSIKPRANPLSASNGNFPYPPLPLGVDAIRILTLEPGGFYDPLIGTLVPVTFESKPKYVALSYTWSDSYTDNVGLPTSPHTDHRLASILPKGLSKTSAGIPRSFEPPALMLNGRSYPLGHNLHLALLHLRSITLPLTLWVDAICINQVDMKERNAQVALMSFIFMRAMKVVAWLGTKDYGNHFDPFQCMAIDWKAGQAPHFAGSLAGATKMRCSVAPDRNTFARVTESSYWTRIWIVQELCLPRLLVFIYGANVWTYEDFRQCSAFKAATPHPSSASHDVINDGFKPMLERFAVRDMRNTDSMRLESLIEQFATSGCAELRDRVYGLVGLANNICPATRTNDAANIVEKDMNPLDSQFNTLPEPSKGLGSISIDYSRSFYEIWTDVIISVYIRAEGIEEQIKNRPVRTVSGLIDWTNTLLTDKGHGGVVRTAGIVQKAFDQMVEKDIISLELCNANPQSYLVPQNLLKTKLEKTRYPQNKPIIRAIGFISAVIIYIGPDHGSLVASFQTYQDWVKSWNGHYKKPSHLDMLRRKNETYMARLMSYEKRDVDRVRNIQGTSTVAWRITEGSAHRRSAPGFAEEHETVRDVTGDDEPAQSDSPRICLGTNGLIALVPPAARAGDIVVQFWKCSAAIVMRPINLLVSGSSTTNDPASSFMLVGRADVAEAHEPKDATEYDTYVKQQSSASFDPMHEESQVSGAVHVDLDLRTLQIITASISTF